MHVLKNLQGLKVRGQGLVSWSLKTRTFREDNDTVSRELVNGCP